MHLPSRSWLELVFPAARLALRHLTRELMAEQQDSNAFRMAHFRSREALAQEPPFEPWEHCLSVTLPCYENKLVDRPEHSGMDIEHVLHRFWIESIREKNDAPRNRILADRT